MGLVKTPWPEQAEAEYKITPALLQEVEQMIGVIHNQGLQGQRRNPHLIPALAPEIISHCREIIKRLSGVAGLHPDDQPGQPPYWVRAIRIMIDDLRSMAEVYEDLENYHRRGNLAAALVLSKAARQGISYLKNTFESIPPPGSRQTTPIEPPEMSEEWRELIENLDISGLLDNQ